MDEVDSRNYIRYWRCFKKFSYLSNYSDIFQAKVQRLEVTGSVALGGAIRAAQHCLNYSLKELESSFCNNGLKVISPNKTNKEVYEKASKAIQSMLLTI